MKVGTKVYLEPIGNQLSFGKDIKESVVTKVGRKYFEIQGNYNKFSLEKMTDVTIYCPNYKIYLSRNEIEEIHEKEKYGNEFRKFFYENISKKLSLIQMKAIQNIIDNPNMAIMITMASNNLQKENCA